VKSPKFTHVDLRAVLFLDDPRTNIAVQPRDQVFVGERATFSFERCVAPWLRPMYEAVWGLLPSQLTFLGHFECGRIAG